MPKNRPFVLTIAGFDPSGGAGILADVKAFEQHRVYGFAINTGNTIQTETVFTEIQWTDLGFVLRSIKMLFENYDIKAVKIGIVPTLNYLKEIVLLLKKLSPTTPIIWDTVLKSTTEFDFIKIENQMTFMAILNSITLITPNYNEIIQLAFEEKKIEAIAKMLAQQCSILLKGGHNLGEIGVDYLYRKDEIIRLPPKNKECYTKHGSGCVLSSAITANIALGQDLKTACSNAKIYIEKYLNSNPSLIGYHYV
jgi:hydroxymethylpyrimidine/phosphomethylpyrimidine kinase